MPIGLPNDFLRALSAGTGGKGRGLEFRLLAGTLQTNADNVLLTYIPPGGVRIPALFFQRADRAPRRRILTFR